MKYGQLNGESRDYRDARAELLAAEKALRDQRERVAALRRGLPLDTVVEDYLFRAGPDAPEEDEPVSEIRLSSLLEGDRKTLVLYQFMYGAAQKKPCPMCTMWTDGFNAIAPHVRQRIAFAIVAQADIRDLRSFARTQGWTNLRLLSSAGTRFKTDLNFEDAEGKQLPGVSVFTRTTDGSLRHFYSASAIMDEGEYRGLDLLTPVWNLFDLTPEGRGNWMPRLRYAA